MLPAILKELTPDECADRHVQLIADIRLMIVHAGDMSKLILDPVLDSYYLIDATLMALPQTQDRVAEMTAHGEAVLNQTTLSYPERQKFAIYARMLKEDDMERIIGSVQTSMNENPNEYGFNPTLAPRVQPALNEYSQATGKFIDLTNHVVDSPNPDVTAKEYVLAGNAASAASFKLWRIADEELDKLLQIRIESYQRRRTKSLFVAAGALMAAIGFVTFITRAISGPLKRQASELQSANEALQGEIAERKRVEAALRTAEEQYRSIFENAVEGIFQTTKEGRYLVANPTLARMYGYDSVAELEASVTDIGSGLYVKPQRREEFQRLIDQTGKIHRFESEIYRKDGSVIWISEHARGVYDETGVLLYYEGTVEDITERKRNEEVLEKLNKQLIDTSRRAGMAEVATGVLHNVGNVLNSVNVSALLITDRLSKSRVSHLAQVSATLRANAENLGAFITSDPKGSKIPGFIASLAERLGNEQTELLREAEGLSKNIAHIKDIVAVQQDYAKVSGVVEVLPAAALVDDALEMNGAAFDRHRVEVVREFDSVPPVRVEKHKVLQILINVIRNAKYAVSESRRLDKRITVSIRRNGNNCVKIAVADNGIGIAPEISHTHFRPRVYDENRRPWVWPALRRAGRQGNGRVAFCAKRGRRARVRLSRWNFPSTSHPPANPHGRHNARNSGTRCGAQSAHSDHRRQHVDPRRRPEDSWRFVDRRHRARRRSGGALWRWRPLGAMTFPSKSIRRTRARRAWGWCGAPPRRGGPMRWPLSMCECRRAGTASKRSARYGGSIPICRWSFARPTRIIRGRR